MTLDRTARKQHAAAEWADLADRLRTVTPQAVGRTVLTVVSLAAVVALSIASWPALLPFIVGGIVAYQLLPVVDALARVMPRFLAALVSVIVVVAAIVGVAILVLPPLAQAFVRFATDLPTTADIDQAIAKLQTQLGTLPDGSQNVLVPVLTVLAAAARDTFSGAAGGLDDLVRSAVGALLNALGALLGLIVLPTWMLVVMSQKRRAQIAINTRITPSYRTDAWAIAAIVDRATGAYLRGYVVTGALVGLMTYLGLLLSPRVGGPMFQEPLTVAVFAGASQVIPIVGPIIGLLPAALIAPLAPDRAVAYVVIYIAARILGATVIGGRLQSRKIGVHPAILVPGVVMIGQFGILWLLLSAPIVAIAVDLVRYVGGRLAEPPRPAGVLPGPAKFGTSTASPAGAPRSVPSVYRPATAPPSIIAASSIAAPAARAATPPGG